MHSTVDWFKKGSYELDLIEIYIDNFVMATIWLVYSLYVLIVSMSTFYIKITWLL